MNSTPPRGAQHQPADRAHHHQRCTLRLHDTRMPSQAWRRHVRDALFTNSSSRSPSRPPVFHRGLEAFQLLPHVAFDHPRSGIPACQQRRRRCDCRVPWHAPRDDEVRGVPDGWRWRARSFRLVPKRSEDLLPSPSHFVALRDSVLHGFRPHVPLQRAFAATASGREDHRLPVHQVHVPSEASCPQRLFELCQRFRPRQRSWPLPLVCSFPPDGCPAGAVLRARSGGWMLLLYRSIR